MNGPDGDKKFTMFIKALEILNKWMKQDNTTVRTAIHNINANAPGISNLLKNTKALAWFDDVNGVRRYFTLTYLATIDYNNLGNVICNLLNSDEDYQGQKGQPVSPIVTNNANNQLKWELFGSNRTENNFNVFQLMIKQIST